MTPLEGRSKTRGPGVLHRVQEYCDPTASLRVLKFLEESRKRCSSDDFIVDRLH